MPFFNLLKNCNRNNRRTCKSMSCLEEIFDKSHNYNNATAQTEFLVCFLSDAGYLNAGYALIVENYYTEN